MCSVSLAKNVTRVICKHLGATSFTHQRKHLCLNHSFFPEPNNSVFGREVVVFHVLITFSEYFYNAILDKLHVTCISEFQMASCYNKTFVSLTKYPIFKLFEELQRYIEPNPPSE